MKTIKANSMLRRFFNRLGGGGVKSLNYKVTMKASSSEGGGDTPSEGGSLADSIVKVLDLNNKEYYGIPDMVVLDTKDGIIDGRGVHSEDLQEPIAIGNQTFSSVYIIEDETRWKSFDSISVEDFSLDDPDYCAGCHFAYSISVVQQKTGADEYVEPAFVSGYQFPFDYDGGPWIFSTNGDAALYKYNNEYYVIFVSYG